MTIEVTAGLLAPTRFTAWSSPKRDAGLYECSADGVSSSAIALAEGGE